MVGRGPEIAAHHHRDLNRRQVPLLAGVWDAAEALGLTVQGGGSEDGILALLALAPEVMRWLSNVPQFQAAGCRAAGNETALAESCR